MDIIRSDIQFPKIVNPNDCTSEIWIYGERIDGKFDPVVLELLGCGKVLARKLNSKVCVVVIDKCNDDDLLMLQCNGADIVYCIEYSSTYPFYNEESYPTIISKVASDYRPEIFLLGATVLGRSIAPRIAAKLGTGLTADCTELDIDIQTRNLIQTRPTDAGNRMAVIVCKNHRPQMATVRPGVFLKHVDGMPKDDFNIITVKIKLDYEPLIKLVKQSFEPITQDLASADIIVAVGLGIGSKENMEIIYNFATAINAEVGASRAVVERGWIDRSRQIGQTGKIVRPRVYFACGISGSEQHCAGIKSSDIIIAINTDREAPIHRYAKWSISHDIKVVLPELASQWKLLINT